MQTYPPPPPPTAQAMAANQLAMAGGCIALGGMAPASAGLTVPHLGQVVPASRILFGLQSLSDVAPAGASADRLIDLLAIVFLAGGVVSLFLALFPRFCKQPGAPAGKPQPPKLKPWLLGFALAIALLALVLAFCHSATPTLFLILVVASLVLVVVDYGLVVRDFCAHASLLAD